MRVGRLEICGVTVYMAVYPRRGGRIRRLLFDIARRVFNRRLARTGDALACVNKK